MGKKVVSNKDVKHGKKQVSIVVGGDTVPRFAPARTKGSQALAKPVNQALTLPINTEALIATAIRARQIDVVERLLMMRRELKAEYAREQFFLSMAAFQGACPIIRKSVDVLNKKEKGGGVRYRYAPLDEIVGRIKSLLTKHGFSYIIKTKQKPKMVKAIVEVHHVAGHMEKTEFAVPIQEDAYMTAPQKVATARTFSMRYAFNNAFGIMTGDVDDDGRSAKIESPNGQKQTRTTPKAINTTDVGKLLAEMTWMPEQTKAMYLKQVATYSKKKDERSLNGLVQSLTKQKALYNKGEKKKT